MHVAGVGLGISIMSSVLAVCKYVHSMKPLTEIHVHVQCINA